MTLCARVLKCLIPATVVPQEAVVRAVVWLGVGKIPMSTQVSASHFYLQLEMLRIKLNGLLLCYSVLLSSGSSAGRWWLVYLSGLNF